MKLTRREAMLGIGCSSFVLPSQATPKNRSPGKLHELAAQAAAQLANGRQIELGLLIPHGSAANVTLVIDAFREATGIVIRPIEAPVDDVNVRLKLDAMTTDASYDLALPATFGVPDLVAAGALLPLTEYAKKYEPEGFRDGLLYQTGDSFDDQIFGFQTDGDAYLMFYHKDMLESEKEQDSYAQQYGRPLFRPQTWEELDRQIAFFHRPDEDMYGGLLFRTPGYVAWEWWVRFHAKGVWPLSPDLEPQIAGEAGVTALEDLIEVSQYLCQEASTLGLFANWERYARGDVFCNIGWGGSQKHLNGAQSKMRGRMLFGPTPGGMVEDELLVTPYFNWGWNYVVTTNASEPEIAYLFALFASSSEMTTRAVRQTEGYFDPFRAEHYQDPEIQTVYSTDFLDVHAQSLRNAIPDLYLAQQGEYFRALGDWIIRALNREVTAQEALRRVSETWSYISLRTGHDVQRQRWMQLREKYPEHVRHRLRDI